MALPLLPITAPVWGPMSRRPLPPFVQSSSRPVAGLGVAVTRMRQSVTDPNGHLPLVHSKS
jgi:hypothetical protein